MAFADKLTVVIDFVTGPAQSGLGKMRGAIGEADGAFGKMKAAGNVAFDSVKENAANFAMAAGSALIAFGVKSVQAFQDTALAAGQFSDATGLAVDEASRLIEVSGDIGIEAGTVESALGKMNKTLGASPELFNKLGVEIARTSTGATDVNGTFLNVVDRLNAIKDPAERARVASQLLGKGWQGMAELIGQGSASLKESLAGVADAQVIDEAELAKAKEFRERMDELNDRLQAVVMTVGEELVPVLSDAAETIGTVTDAFQAVNTAAEDLTGIDLFGWADKLTNPIGAAMDAMDWFTDAIGFNVSATDGISYAWDYFTGNLEDATTAIEYGSDAAEEMARMYGERLVPTLDTASGAIGRIDRSAQDFTEQVRDAEAATRDLDATYQLLTGELDQAEAWDNLAVKMWEYHANTEQNDGMTRNYIRSLGDTVMALDAIPEETKAELIAQLREGDIATVEAYLARLREGVTVPVRFAGQGGVGFEKRAAGGPVRAGQPYLVGEKGPEIVVPGQSGTVIPNNRIGGGSGVGGGGMNVTINMPPGSNGQDVVAAIRDYEKRNGKSWRS
jgi:hypothetical protein